MDEFVAEDRAQELGSLPQHENFDSFVRELHDHAEGRALPGDWVPVSTFWLVDGEQFLGKVEARHELTEELRRYGGHVGYSIRPEMRWRGHGTRALALVLPHCLDLGLTHALLTCDTTNVASRRIIESNGGELEDITQVSDRPVPTMRYWIDVVRQIGATPAQSAMRRQDRT
jgi:predicted acetyltransferase